MGAYRYTTNLITCLREWRWYDVVGRPEVARGIIACTRAGALALPLLPALPMVPPVWAALPVPYPAIYGTPPYLDALPGGFGDIAGGAGMVSEFARGGFAAAEIPLLGRATTYSASGVGGDLMLRAYRSPAEAFGHAAPSGSPAVSLPQFDTSLTPRPPGQTPPTTTVTIPEIVVRPDAPQDVPEPASFALLGMGVLGWGLARIRGWL
jgi:hypothetical protein